MLQMPTQAQINAALRYAGVTAGTIGTVVTVVGLLPSDQAHAIVGASQTVLSDLEKLIGDSYLLAGLVGPIIVALLARAGVKSASPKSQIASVQAMPAARVTVSDPKLAEGIPGVTVETPVPPAP